MRRLPCCLLAFILPLPAPAAVEDALRQLAAVGREGEGNEAASAAWREVAAAGPSALPSLLASVGRGSPVADNWLRLAGDSIVDRATRGQESLPLEEVVKFVSDTSHPPAGRRLAWDLLRQADPARAAALEPSLLQDPVQDLRRPAVQRILDRAKTAGDQARDVYEEALAAVRDEDQTKFIVDELKKLGVTIDLPKHFGFLQRWQVIGPFENSGHKGFEEIFPPEREIRATDSFEGKGKTVAWQPFTTADDYGKLDFNKALGTAKEVTGYATTTFQSPEEKAAELRLGTKNATKVWLNGRLLFSRDEYHRGQQMDQYRMPCRLQKGVNVILVKCCQNEQKEEWTVEWEFQLRVCDSTGAAILSSDRNDGHEKAQNTQKGEGN